MTTIYIFRLPIFIPIAFSDLNWNAYPHVQLLAASTNFIVHDDITLEVGNNQKCIEQILLSMHSVGLSVDLPESLKHMNENQKNILSSSSSSSSSNSPQDQLLAITESLKAFATSIQALAHQSIMNEVAHTKHHPSSSTSITTTTTTNTNTNDNNNDNNIDENRQVLSLSQSYLGVSNGSMVLTDIKHPSSVGYEMIWWNSLHFEIIYHNNNNNNKIQDNDNDNNKIKDDDKMKDSFNNKNKNHDNNDNNKQNNYQNNNNQNIIAIVTETNLRKVGISPCGDIIDGRDMKSDHPLFNWGNNLFVRTSDFKGEYMKEQLLLTGMIMNDYNCCSC